MRPLIRNRFRSIHTRSSHSTTRTLSSELLITHIHTFVRPPSGRPIRTFVRPSPGQYHAQNQPRFSQPRSIPLDSRRYRRQHSPTALLPHQHHRNHAVQPRTTAHDPHAPTSTLIHLQPPDAGISTPIHPVHPYPHLHPPFLRRLVPSRRHHSHDGAHPRPELGTDPGRVFPHQNCQRVPQAP